MDSHSAAFSVILCLCLSYLQILSSAFSSQTSSGHVTPYSENKFHTHTTQHAILYFFLASTDISNHSPVLNSSVNIPLLRHDSFLTVYKGFCYRSDRSVNNGMSSTYVKESVVAYFIFCNYLGRLQLTTTGLSQESCYQCQVLNKDLPNVKRQFGLN